ncbi:3-deoxy-D-manno-octulosonic acid transferase [Leptospira sp. 96542]|nr:3-deoxy-D-manno-octulosonic acid transferase [Leptospira sp. 96542]
MALNRPSLSLLLYSALMWVAQPLLRRKLRRRGEREPGYRVAIEERFGRYATPPWPDDGRTLWVHAVSLGETRAAAVLLKELRARWPDYRILLTHGTATGRAEGAALLQSWGSESARRAADSEASQDRNFVGRVGDAQLWQPWDTPEAVRRFLRHVRPRLGLLMETEVWPNLSAACAEAQVPLVLVNARLSAKSLRNAQRLAWLARPAYRSLTAVHAQTEDDAVRLASLGAPVRAVPGLSGRGWGNLKFDARPDAVQLERARAWRAALRRPVVMLASSREGEEAMLLRALQDLDHDRRQAVTWLIVPRHPQRFEEVAALIEGAGWRVARRSAWSDEGPRDQATAADVWLGDTLGEMALYYGMSSLALLGGSFAPLGGQNLIEAAACACPVFMGPHTFNFQEAATLAQEAGAASRCADLPEALDRALALLGHPVSAQAMVQAATRFAQAHRGAAARTVQALASYLD